jgi:hypothetical protein
MPEIQHFADDKDEDRRDDADESQEQDVFAHRPNLPATSTVSVWEAGRVMSSGRHSPSGDRQAIVGLSDWGSEGGLSREASHAVPFFSITAGRTMIHPAFAAARMAGSIVMTRLSKARPR